MGERKKQKNRTIKEPTKMNRSRMQKIKMFNKNKHCRRCGVLMWLPPSGKILLKSMPKTERDAMATIGHFYSKLDERRQTEPNHKKKHKLICYKCNIDEASLENEKIPLEVRWELSKSYPWVEQFKNQIKLRANHPNKEPTKNEQESKKQR